VPQYLILALVSTPCHLEPDVRFSLIRLSDNLRPEAFKTSFRSALFQACHFKPGWQLSVFWLSALVCAEVLVICLGVLLAQRACTVTYLLAWRGWSRGPSLTTSCVVSLVSSTMASSDFSSGFPSDFTSQLIPSVTLAVDERPDETSPVPSSAVLTSRSPYAGGFLTAAIQSLGRFFRLRFAWAARHPLFPLRANISTLQASRDVTGYWFALLSQEDTSLQHIWLPRSTGRLLHGLLALTMTGLAPASW